MTSLLQHPLILKYFSPQPGEVIPLNDGWTYTLVGFDPSDISRWVLCERILTAMQEPIRINEEYIALSGGNVLGVMRGVIEDDFHPHNLRLPDRFQPKQECKCDLYARPGCFHPCPNHKPDPVESLKKRIVDSVDSYANGDLTGNWDICLRNDLDDLVRLARESK